MKRVEVKGRIVSDDHLEVYQWFGYAATSPSVVKQAIFEAEEAGEKELLVEINSGGGSVFAGAEIYYALKKFNGTVNIEIPSLAASAASFIAMAGSKVSMSIMGQLMIHGASTSTVGNHQNMEETRDFLRNIDDSIINAYLTKTSMSREELRTMMNKDTWMTAQQALDYGLIDEILFETQQPDAVANAGNSESNESLPQEVIDKVKAEILAGKTNDLPDPANNAETQKPENKEEEKMDLEKLKNDHPELFKQVKNLGFKEGVAAENKRIKEIEDLSVPGNETLVNKAKYEEPVTAEKLAVQIVRAQKELGAHKLTNIQKDAAPLNTIPASHAPEADNLSDEDQAAAALTQLWGGK